MMFTYDVCSLADSDLYDKCVAKFKAIFAFDKQLEDVDGTKLSIFDYGGKCVKIVNDETLNMLFVESEVDIAHLIYA